MTTRRLASPFVLAALLLAGRAGAVESGTPPAPLRDELQHVLLRLIESGEFAGTQPEDITFRLDAPAQRMSNLGLLVDSTSAEHARDGLAVLAVSPGSSAEHLGVRSGDVLVAVQEVELTNRGADEAGRAMAARLLRETVDALPDDMPLRLAVRRDGRPLVLAGPLHRVTLPPIHLVVGRDALIASTAPGDGRVASVPPASGGCGRVSTFDVAPRARQLHAVKLLAIDGHAAGPAGTQNSVLDAGMHTLELAEQIESRYLSFNARQRPSGGKMLQIEIKPDTTYFLGARLDPARRMEWKDGAYWEPVVWKEAAEPCR